MCDAFRNGKNSWAGALGANPGSSVAIGLQNQWEYENQDSIRAERKARDDAFMEKKAKAVEDAVANGTYNPADFPADADQRKRRDARGVDGGDEAKAKFAGDAKKKIPPLVTPLAPKTNSVLGSVNLLGGKGA